MSTYALIPAENRPRGYKTFFMLNSPEHKISSAHKKEEVNCFVSLSDVVFTILTNVIVLMPHVF